MTNASPSRLAWTRLGIATAVAAMGAIDVLSALLSHPSERLHALRRLVPTEVLDTSRTFTLLAGVLLLFTAWGLRRGKRRAFVTALFLCAISVPVNLLKAVDIEDTATRPSRRSPERAREFLIEHLARFYDFTGLFRWKKKFAPAFEDRYLVYPSPGVLPRVVLALVRAQSPGGLLSYLRTPRA